MAGSWCEVMQLPASGCWHCRPVAAHSGGQAWEELWELAAEGIREGAGPLAGAQYGGRCRGCGERYEAGDLIAFSEDEDGWLCAGCAR